MDIKKIIRGFVIALSFLFITYAFGMETREAQQFFFLLGGMILFGLLLRNIWITLFLWWSVFLYTFFKFQLGHNYLINIFMGCVLYYIVKVAFEKKHVDLFINAVLWIIVINILYMHIQLLGLDFMFKQRMDTMEGFMGWGRSVDPAGMMGFKACMGMLMAFGVPLLASRPSKMSMVCALLLFIPIYLSQASICVLAGVVGLLFVLWHKSGHLLLKWHRMAVLGLIAVILLGGSVYYAFRIDNTPTSINLRLVAWRGILEDTTIHPVTGWGMDSFRNITAQKKHLYTMNPTTTPKGNLHLDFLDNPHNLYISLMFEWGIISLILLGGYLRGCGLRFMKAVKEPNTIALAGFGIVFLIVSIAQFPMFLSRMAILIVIAAGLYEVQTK